MKILISLILITLGRVDLSSTNFVRIKHDLIET
ncbi:hypothetical protein HNQ55_000511 [Thalassotalea piscium]|uniref:Uncharacterized protein n=1 Tax=Thalassotalea piscium TaxID=1230533 RepID=A0A7X0NEL9_9GAMM|nr:hypothetical protein [Thalassotalea piscium]